MSNKINPNDPAMPSPIEISIERAVKNDPDAIERGAPQWHLEVKKQIVNMPGLSIRAELAARAMQGMCTEYENMEGHELTRAEDIARRAVRVADALINELNKEV